VRTSVAPWLPLLLSTCLAVPALAADRWIEVRSEHFTVVSNASEGTTRRLVWQLEQVRSVTAALFSWAQSDLNKPLSVIALRDESSMRAFAPQYWEDRGSIRPASVWVTAPDAHYLAIRTDVEVGGRRSVNPYLTAYHSYVDLVLSQSLDRDLPVWVRQGFAGVLSNTMVLDDQVLFGMPIPFYVQTLRQRPLLPLSELLTITRWSPEVTESARREVFDAEAWAFMHYLIFGDESAHVAQLDAYAQLVSSGKDAAAAFVATLGPIEPLESGFRRYYQRDVFSYRQIGLDLSVERERFPARPLAPAESATMRAMFLVAMRRPEEARAAIAEARKADRNAAGSYVAEGLLADQDGKPEEAKAAYGKASALGATCAYAYYRLASLTWEPAASEETYAELEQQLTKAVALNTRYAAAYAWLGEIRSRLGNDSSIGLIRRAIVLEPTEASHRLRAANVNMREGKPDEARADAQAALALAETDAERRDAQRILDAASEAVAAAASRAEGAEPAAAERPPTPPAASSSAPEVDMDALNAACQSGDDDACGQLLPTIEAECAQNKASACGFAGFLYERGRGVSADAGRAATFYQQSCEGGNAMGCIGHALLQAQGSGVEKDAAKAKATLDALCTEDVMEACVQLARVIVNDGPSADLARARELLAKACDAKHERACQLLKSLPKRPG